MMHVKLDLLELILVKEVFSPPRFLIKLFFRHTKMGKKATLKL